MVQVDTAAMLVIDIHAHISGNEVIGLLGGLYSREEKALQVAVAEPCNSLSTGMQCEMDPGVLTVQMLNPFNSIQLCCNFDKISTQYI